jgi:hypothetical protein
LCLRHHLVKTEAERLGKSLSQFQQNAAGRALAKL